MAYQPNPDPSTETTLAAIKDTDGIKKITDTVTVQGTVTANTGLSQPLTDAQLRATAVPVSGTFWQATQPVSGTFWQATQPVSGTVTAAQATAANLNMTEASASAIKTAVEKIDDMISGSEAQVDVVTLPSPISGPGNPTIDSYTHAAFNLAAGANQSLKTAPGANKQIWVYGIGFTVNVAGTVSFQDEDDTALTGIMQIGATGGMTVAPSGNFAMPIWKLATNKALEVDVVTSELDGWICYAIVSV